MGASSDKRVTPARLFAYNVLRQVRLREGYARELFDNATPPSPLSPEDAAFARVLVLGAVSCVGTLDELIDGVINSPSDIEDDVRDALRLSVYELYFLGKRPHAAVYQGVELVRAVRKRAMGAANFILRRLAEKRDAFPSGDPLTDTGALARLYGFPLWMTERVVERYGVHGAVSFMKASNEPAPVTFTVNACKATDEEVLAQLDAAQIAYAPACVVDETYGKLPVAFAWAFTDASAVAAPVVSQLISDGQIIITDAASQAIAISALSDGCPASMLEVGAGRGTKTLLLQSASMRMYGRQIPITSIDYLDFKADLLRSRLAKGGITEVEVLVADATDLDAVFPKRSFDTLFIDAPCSGLGTLRRHPEIRWRLAPEEIAALAETGRRMLTSAAGHTNPGGAIVYSTCTWTREETSELAESFLASDAGSAFCPVPLAPESRYFSSLLVPGSADAHFAAKFRLLK